MRTTPLIVAVSLFSFIVLFTPGCTDLPVNREQFGVDAGIDTDTRPPVLAIPSADVEAPKDSSSVHLTDPIAFLLAPSTCNGRRLPATTPGLELESHGMTLWHLCYKTPTSTTSTHPLASQQPELVTIEVAMNDGERLVLATPTEPGTTPSTISVLVALPEGVAPAFQGTNYYESSRRLGIVASSDGHSFPTIQGVMRSWRVLYDQSQDEYIPAHVCRRPTLQNPDGAFFIPLDACIAQSCPMIERLDCRNL